MTQDTTQAAHAVLGASGYKKWSTCTMSVAVEKDLPDEESDYSREGTYAHACGEALLRCYLSGNDGADVELATAMMDPKVSEDAAEFYNETFARHVQNFVDYTIARIEELREEHGEDQVIVLLEQRLRFDRWVPQGFGTGDVVIIVPGKIIVIDLKFGAGVYVDGVRNGQIRLYALGAYDKFHVLYDFRSVEVVIHQPRMNNVSGETVELEGELGLLAWADTLVVPRAKIAWAAYNGDYSEARFAPGKHCSECFCKARFVCAARAKHLLELAELPYTGDEPHTLTVEQMEAVVTKADLAAKWAKDVQAYLLSQASKGKVELRRFKLVEGRSFREITDPRKAADLLMRNGYAATDVYKPPELVGLGELEHLVGKKKLTELLGELLHKPTGKLTLASVDDSAAVVKVKKNKGTKDFDDLEN